MDNSTPDKKFENLKLSLPPSPVPVGKYLPFVTVNNLVYTSGHGPLKNDNGVIVGKVGIDLSKEEGKAAAQQVGLAILATIQSNFGSFNKIKRVVKVLGMVNCTTDFQDHPYVINGCSELFAKIWGNENVGARSAVGMNSLPSNISVEIEVIFELS